MIYMHKRLSLLAFGLSFFMPFSSISAQNKTQKVGDFIESKSYNEDNRGAQRSMNYFPEGNGWACVNGNNRFTRALYGGYTDFRIETSDRPVFAAYKKKDYRNVSFRVTINNVTLALDSTSYCKALYVPGTRSYVVGDKSWGNTLLYIDALAFADSEGAVWRVSLKDDKNKKVKADIVCRTSDIANPKLRRNGDMGADPYGVFEASDRNVNFLRGSVKSGSTIYFVIENQQMRVASAAEGKALYAKAEKYRRSIAERISFSTPDPYINNLGGAISIAADGDWDGDTWLHGCVGWRSQLAGWRAGYAADPLGWDDRAKNHFKAYSESQLTNVPAIYSHPSQDSAKNLCRAVEKWGTPMYSNGYICRYPHKADKMNHYDMNLNYIDALLWHFSWNADTAEMRSLWPTLARHLAWEKMNFDPDNDGLYDAYCCIWASDALYYNSGGVTHSSAYNYRANLLAARIAEILGCDAAPYKKEADKILNAMNSRLWLGEQGTWAEFQDFMGLKRKHTSPALWTVYTAIDCGAGSKEQFAKAADWVSRNIPHIKVEGANMPKGDWQTISTSNWLPYSWSINNVAPAEVMNMALAYFEAGKKREGFNLMKSNILDQMYLGGSPANFGQLSFYDAARGECYRDFGDVIGISSRVFVQGLFGIVPDALNGKCLIRPGFPDEWDKADFHAPYLDYSFRRTSKGDVYTFHPRFAQKLSIDMDINGKILSRVEQGDSIVFTVARENDSSAMVEYVAPVKKNLPELADIQPKGKLVELSMDKTFNANVSDIFKNEYLSPASPYTTLRIPKQGIGEWCHPELSADIDDSVFRSKISNGEFATGLGVAFRSPKQGHNIAYTSLWDNYPDSISINVRGKYSKAYLLLAGSTNHMQSRIANGVVVATYSDGTSQCLQLVNPDNWCPIEQDYFIDDKAFCAAGRPYRLHFGSGAVSRNLGDVLDIKGVYGREIPGGAAQILTLPLNPAKKLVNITLRTLSNDVVIGLMAVTFEK